MLADLLLSYVLILPLLPAPMRPPQRAARTSSAAPELTVSGRLPGRGLKQLGRTFDVGKQDSHMLALAFEGCTGGEDLVGQMRRGVGQRGTLSLRRR